jgi:hypothetical protein
MRSSGTVERSVKRTIGLSAYSEVLVDRRGSRGEGCLTRVAG